MDEQMQKISNGPCYDVHPRAKVRKEEVEEDNPFSLQSESPSMMLLKVLESLSSHKFHPIEEKRNDAPSLAAKIPSTCVKNKAAVRPQSIPVPSKVMSKNEKQSSRACSVPRPRAVLSSPDNDGMIGNQNKLISRSSSVPRKDSLKQKRHSLMKEIPIQGKAANSPSKAAITNSRLKQRNPSAPPPSLLAQKPCPRKAENSIGVSGKCPSHAY